MNLTLLTHSHTSDWIQTGLNLTSTSAVTFSVKSDADSVHVMLEDNEADGICNVSIKYSEVTIR